MPMVGALLALGSGGVVGLVLGLIGGGGSILAVPLLVYAVGVPPHVAIGTAAGVGRGARTRPAMEDHRPCAAGLE